MADQHPVLVAIEAGQRLAHEALTKLDSAERDAVMRQLIASRAGRRWLRGMPDLDSDVADQLLAHEEDYRQQRRDRTLAAAIQCASAEAIERHASAIAAGPAAIELWTRLASEPERLVQIATMIAAGKDRQATESTLHLLVLDPLDPFSIAPADRLAIATAALAADDAEVRGLAAEYVAARDPGVLAGLLERLAADESERVRGVAWAAALHANRAAAVDFASELLSDEAAPRHYRRSALVALGNALPTSQMADLLGYFVIHPDRELAADAANLLYRLHRNPTTAMAARESPHEDVRELAEQLLDPLRGSPAAGGSRPGDPTRATTDIFADMVRQLEEQEPTQSDDSRR